MTLLWVAFGIYLVGAFLLFIGAVVEFATAYDTEDRRRGARILVSIPVWPLYWGKRLVILIAESISLVKEENKK